MSIREITVGSLAETRAAAITMATALRPAILNDGLVVGLSGELGAGKTAFSRELCAALGVKAAVSSPTFVLEHEYEGTEGILIEHWDLYRLGAAIPEELFEPVEAGVLRLIEWIDRSPELLKGAGLHLTFQILGEIQRKISAQWQQNSLFDTLLDAAF